jgi:hypothetical protein
LADNAPSDVVTRVRASPSGRIGRPAIRATARQQRRLVVASGKQPDAVQRHGYQDLGIAQQRRPGARHHGSQGRSEVGAVAVFER